MAELPVFLLTGVPGAGRSTVARLSAMRLPRGHLGAEDIHSMIVSGGLRPDQDPHDEAMRQLTDRARQTVDAILAAT